MQTGAPIVVLQGIELRAAPAEPGAWFHDLLWRPATSRWPRARWSLAHRLGSAQRVRDPALRWRRRPAADNGARSGDSGDGYRCPGPSGSRANTTAASRAGEPRCQHRAAGHRAGAGSRGRPDGTAAGDRIGASGAFLPLDRSRSRRDRSPVRSRRRPRTLCDPAGQAAVAGYRESRRRCRPASSGSCRARRQASTICTSCPPPKTR